MKKWYSWLILANLIVLLIYFNFSVWQKENILKQGQLVLLELAPVDPRSLMQGDYMELRYHIAQDLPQSNLSNRGFLVVRLDSLGVAQRVRLQRHRTPISLGEYLLSYHRPNDWNLYLGAESFFFQEGESAKYDSAKYGALRVDHKGHSVLTGLYDAQRKEIK